MFIASTISNYKTSTNSGEQFEFNFFLFFPLGFTPLRETDYYLVLVITSNLDFLHPTNLTNLNNWSFKRRLFEDLPERSFVNFRFTEVGIFKLSTEKFLTRLNEAPGREDAVTGQSVDSSLVMGELK